MKILLASLVTLATAAAQTVMPPFDATLSIDRLGVLGTNAYYGGTAFRAGNSNVLLFGEYQSDRVDAFPVVRDALGHPISVGARTTYATVSGPDGSLAYGPNNVLFYTVYPSNELGQMRANSVTENKLVDLSTLLGSSGSVGACAFVPAGRSGAGRLKIAVYGSNEWHDLTIAADGTGTYDVTAAGAAIPLTGGPEGIAYPPATMPTIGSNCVLVCEWSQNVIAVYTTNSNGDPIPASRQVLVANIVGPSGGAVDPVSGDIVFGSSAGYLYVLRGVASCGQISAFGSGAPGQYGVPTLTITGCARIGHTLTMQVGNARPGCFGLLGFGFYPGGGYYANVPILSSFDASIAHFVAANGTWSMQWPVPVLDCVGLMHLYLQSGYLDAAAPAGVSATGGVDLYLH